MAEITLTPEGAAEAIRKRGRLAIYALLAAGQASALVLSKHAIEKRLVRANPPYLNRRTGTLIRSVAASPKAAIVSDKGVEASIGTNLDYGRAHELGFRGAVQVRAHARQNLRSKSAGTSIVRAHERQVDMPARRYLADTLKEDVPTINSIANHAMAELLRTGEVPSAGELIRGGGRA